MSDELVFKFKRSGELDALSSEVLSESEKSGVIDKLKATVESMVLSDLEHNAGLLESLARGSDGAVDPRRVDLMFERRIRSEVEAGLAGGPIDEYIEAAHGRLLNEIKARVAKLQNA